MSEIVKDEYKDIRSLDALRKLSISKYGVLEMYKSARTTATMRAFLSSDFDKLISINTESARNLARDLFMYSFYDNGLGFGPNNFGTLFSTFFVTKFPEYIDSLRNMNFKDAESIFAGFYEQFCVNHSDLFPEVPSDHYSTLEDQPDTVVVENKYVANIKGAPRDYIRIYNSKTKTFDLYMKDQSVDLEKSTVYRKINSYVDPSGNGRVKYNALKDASQLADTVDMARVEASREAPTRFIEEAERQNDEEQMLNELDDLFADDSDDLDFLDDLDEQRSIDPEEEYDPQEGLDRMNENPCNK